MTLMENEGLLVRQCMLFCLGPIFTVIMTHMVRVGFDGSVRSVIWQYAVSLHLWPAYGLLNSLILI